MAANTLEKTAGTEMTQAEGPCCGKLFQPNVDIIEAGNELKLLVDMPGVSSDSIEVGFENGTLSVHGRVKPRDCEQQDYLMREYDIGDFHRNFEIGETIDAAGICAEYADGVLTLRLPKVEALKPRKITVTAK